MFVDSTNLLNMRHCLEDGDKAWQFPYTKADDIVPWTEVQALPTHLCSTPSKNF